MWTVSLYSLCGCGPFMKHTRNTSNWHHGNRRPQYFYASTWKDSSLILLVHVLALQIVNLDFSSFHTEYSDYVRVYDGYNENNMQIASYSGYYSSPPTGIKSSYNWMFVTFTSNWYSYQGFNAYYSSESSESWRIHHSTLITNFLPTTTCSR